MLVKNNIRLEFVVDRLTGKGKVRVQGLMVGEEKLLESILKNLAKIVNSQRFRDELIKRAFSNRLVKSKDPNVAPIWRREKNLPLEA